MVICPKCSHVAVYNWIKSFGYELEALCSNLTLKVVEIDEMPNYVSSKKNYCWIWLAVDRYRKKFINGVLGDRSAATGQQLWKTIEGKEIGQVATDSWKAYEHFIPSNNLVQSKAETFTVEGYNSLFRHFLARLRRKTKCYSKSKKMLQYSIMLLMAKWNNELEAIVS